MFFFPRFRLFGWITVTTVLSAMLFLTSSSAPFSFHLSISPSHQTACPLLLLLILQFCESEARFRLLYTFLKKNMKRKLMVFFSSCDSVEFHHRFFNYISLPVLGIHVRSIHVCMCVRACEEVLGCVPAGDICLILGHLLVHRVVVSQGKQKQAARSRTFFEFCNADHGILLCTDGKKTLGECVCELCVSVSCVSVRVCVSVSVRV